MTKIMTDPILYGFPVSPHVRAARIAFAEKGVAVTFNEIGFADLGTEAYGRINPFRKMPALVDGEVTLYETPALLIYADGIGQGASLQPADVAERARMWQFIGVAQHHLFPVGVMQLYFHTVLAGLIGVPADPDVAQKAVAPTAGHLDALEAALGSGYLAGTGLSLADLYCGAMVDYIARTRAGHELLAVHPRVGGWLEALRERDSFKGSFAAMLTGTDEV